MKIPWHFVCFILHYTYQNINAKIKFVSKNLAKF